MAEGVESLEQAKARKLVEAIKSEPFLAIVASEEGITVFTCRIDQDKLDQIKEALEEIDGDEDEA